MENFGMQVKISFGVWAFPTILRNVTEIHYRYPSTYPDGESRIAFESDIHSTGCTYKVSDIEEFETSLEFEIAEEF